MIGLPVIYEPRQKKISQNALGKQDLKIQILCSAESNMIQVSAGISTPQKIS